MAEAEFDLRQLGEIVQAIEELPAELREALALGPLDDPDCRICRVLRYDEVWNARAGDAGAAVLDFHAVDDTMLVAALTNVIGTTRRATAAEVVEAEAALVRRQGFPLAWVGFDALADQLAFMRALFVYQVAGWRP